MDLQISDLENRLKQLGLGPIVSPKVKELILSSIDNLNFGARPVKRKIEVMIENKVASLLIERSSGEGTHVSIDTDQDEIVVGFTDKKPNFQPKPH